MAENIKWETDLDIVLQRAREDDKFILLSFFNPE
jgi:hypothetical protein